VRMLAACPRGGAHVAVLTWRCSRGGATWRCHVAVLTRHVGGARVAHVAATRWTRSSSRSAALLPSTPRSASTAKSLLRSRPCRHARLSARALPHRGALCHAMLHHAAPPMPHRAAPVCPGLCASRVARSITRFATERWAAVGRVLATCARFPRRPRPQLLCAAHRRARTYPNRKPNPRGNLTLHHGLRTPKERGALPLPHHGLRTFTTSQRHTRVWQAPLLETRVFEHLAKLQRSRIEYVPSSSSLACTTRHTFRPPSAVAYRR
jgi:hypothetical protein